MIETKIPITPHEILWFKDQLVEGETIQYAICYRNHNKERIRVTYTARIEKKYPYVVLLSRKGKRKQKICMSYIKLLMATIGIEEEEK